MEVEVPGMDQPVVAGVDGSDSSLEAVDWAADLAARHGRALRLVHASLWERYEGGGTRAREVLAAAERRAAGRRPDVKLSLDTVAEAPVDALLGEAIEAFVLVVGHRGRGPLTSAMLGSVSLGVAGRAPCPVTVVRGSALARAGRFGRVVLGVDATEQGRFAVDFAFAEAGARGCELRAVHAWRGPGPGPEEDVDATEAATDAEERLERAVGPAAAAHPGVPLALETVDGPPRPALLHAAEAADLLVLGAHQRRGAPGLHLGLVGHALLHYAACPVTVAPQP
ncbi:universal stress protein [Streptomyces sp. 6N223]|uniref:universal stress protein n=1 Tax=Streptomyces sp. 6N223 TaxID=3457412 RepID=UPI003FD62239